MGALAAEPDGGVRNREEGANCLSAASAGWQANPLFAPPVPQIGGRDPLGVRAALSQ